nr:MAG TPA: hypothetical protein [Caudoviricetes sp.]
MKVHVSPFPYLQQITWHQTSRLRRTLKRLVFVIVKSELVD